MPLRFATAGAEPVILKTGQQKLPKLKQKKKIVKNKAQYNIKEVWDKNQIVQLIIIGIPEGEVRE